VRVPEGHTNADGDADVKGEGADDLESTCADTNVTKTFPEHPTIYRHDDWTIVYQESGIEENRIKLF